MKKYYKYVIICAMLLGLSSCDFLDVDDSSMSNRELAFSNPNNVEGMAYNVYSYVRGSFSEIGGNSTLANACDEADLNNRYAAVQAFNDGTWSIYTNPDDLFAHYYAGIRAANHFLEGTENVNYDHFKEHDNNRYTIYTKRLKDFRNEVVVLRAYFHFELLKRYGGIPIITKVLNIGDNADLKRNSYSECVDFIASELNRVVDQVDVKAVDGLTGRVTKGMIYALKCRLYLYAASPLNNNGTYDNRLCDSASVAFIDLDNLGLYSIALDYRQAFLDRTTTNNKEIIFDRRMTNDNWMEKNNYPLGGSPEFAYKVGDNLTSPSQNLVDDYEMIDGTPFDWNNPAHAENPYLRRDPRLLQTILVNGDPWNGSTIKAYEGGVDGIGLNNTTTTGYYLKKFINHQVNLRDNKTAAHVYHLFRYGEMLLNYAEAMNQAHGPDVKLEGAKISAREAINRVRARKNVGMPPVTETGKTEFAERVRRERRIELAFEGHRFWDVRRWMIADLTENKDLRGMKIVLNSANKPVYDPNFVIEKRVFKAPAMYRYPIQYRELLKYKNLTQDENWSAIQ